MNKRIILGITGATGMIYVKEFLELASVLDVEIHAIISDAGRQVMELELGLAPENLNGLITAWYDARDFAAPMSSGSSRFDAMLVLPCTMGTLAAIANGMSANLIHRAADVTLKERRPLVLAARETPLNRTHLVNMLAVHEAGATVCPPMPSFYHRPETIRDMARAFAGRICDQLGLEVPGMKRWGEEGMAESDQEEVRRC